MGDLGGWVHPDVCSVRGRKWAPCLTNISSAVPRETEKQTEKQKEAGAEEEEGWWW